MKEFVYNEEGQIVTKDDEVVMGEREAKEYIKTTVLKTAQDLIEGETYVKELQHSLAKELRGSTKMKEEEFEKKLMIFDIKVDALERRLLVKENTLRRLESTMHVQADQVQDLEGAIRLKNQELKELGRKFKKAFKYASKLDEMIVLLNSFNALRMSPLKTTKIDSLED